MKDKEESTGVNMPTFSEEVISTCGTKGHPLFWQEWKDVDIFTALFKDLLIERVFDVSVGSGAAATAAGILGIGYEGFAMSSGHANWLDNILDKSIFAIIADGEGSQDDEEGFRAELRANFSNIIEEGRKYLAAEEDDHDEDAGDSDGN